MIQAHAKDGAESGIGTFAPLTATEAVCRLWARIWTAKAQFFENEGTVFLAPALELHDI